MIREAKARRRPLLLAELEKDRAKIQAAFGPKFAELCAAHPRFTNEACEHIYLAGVFAARRDTILHRQCGRHLTGREMTEACADYAREAFGNSAKERMKNWGLTNSSDIGDLVFLLVEKGLLRASPDDQRSDFEGLPFLEVDAQPDKI